MPILLTDYIPPVPRTESGIYYAFNKYVYGKNRVHWLSNLSQSPQDWNLGPLFSAQRNVRKNDQLFPLHLSLSHNFRSSRVANNKKRK